MGNVELEVIRSNNTWLFSTSLGSTDGLELATEIDGKELNGILEKEGKAKHTWVDSGS